MDRISTGIRGLDALLEGGIPKGKVLLVKGATGTGKTIMGLSFLIQSAKEKQRGAYLTLEESAPEIISTNLRLMPSLREFVDSKVITFFDRSIQQDILVKPDIKTVFSEGKAKGLTKSDIKDPRQFEKFIDLMFMQLDSGGYTRLVIDSINSLKRKNRLMLKSLKQTYDQYDHYELVLNLVQRAKVLGITTYLLAETWPMTAETEYYESYLADGVIELDVNETLNKRLIKVKKMRATKHTLEPCSFEFVEGQGIEVKPVGVM